jgi:sortase (surface protein transpeptidase)
MGAAFLLSILLIAGCYGDRPSGMTADASVAVAAEPSTAPTIATSVAPPVSVAVPSAGINSKLVRLGLHDDRTMEVPGDYDVAGWYVHGPRPGDIGPAVIAGHVDSKSGPAVFHRLRDLTVGDSIAVGRADGSVAVFRVDAVEQYPKNRFPTAKVYGDLDHAGLRLITCGGDFDRSHGHYRDNIVVYASLRVIQSS